MSQYSVEIAVVGGGITAHTAAVHAAAGGCTVALLCDEPPAGGLVVNVGELDGFPALGQIGGAELTQQLAAQARALGVQVVPERVTGITAGSSSKTLSTGARQWRAKQVIAATGARLRSLDVEGAERFRDRGLLQCAWCNAGLYRGRRVVVVGGGDSALQEALHLAKFADSVTVVVRGERLRARQVYIDRASQSDHVAFRWASQVCAIAGEDSVKAVRLRDLQSGALDEIPCDGVFAYIGLQPNSEWLGDLVDRDPSGAVRTDATLATRTPGLYAAGALRSGYRGRLTSAVGEATEAAMGAVAALSS